jgi:hypothetical protein
MVTATQSKANNGNTKSTAKASNGTSNGSHKAAVKSKRTTPGRKNDGRFRKQRGSDMPSWLTTAVSVIGVGVAVGAGLYATRHQWMSKAEAWRDEFSAAFADDETDYENFDQTRNAGVDAMRDHPGEDWEDIDDMSDASFPASDPPSFTPGRA